ncbi:hypothetical protein DSL72_001365 [Monilinia vaccinii-corymbosi]|uniref:Uncharacterized protein n=1 Tax=Monilinia vaccinii-corymbosi TaxID=61207 RepID=A0A8A3P7A7_9HELO|nr:hypothetical protein DSL72_001365 [Monilinia vaccinii-corymbosi]
MSTGNEIRVGAGEVEKAPHISTLTNSEWSKVNHTLPIPSLQFLFHLECDIADIRPIGDGGRGGRFEGPRIRGTMLPGGGDWETIQKTPASTTTTSGDTLTIHHDARYTLLTHDNHCIYVSSGGVRTGPREIIDALGEEDKQGAHEFKMRTCLSFECDNEGKYGWLNRVVAIGSCGGNGSMVIYDAYEVL